MVALKPKETVAHPRVTQSWKEPVMAPRSLGGAASAWKTGTRPLVAPILYGYIIPVKMMQGRYPGQMH